MSQQLYSLSLDAIKYICNLINQTVDLPSTILDDLHIATNTTYSSYKLDALLKALKEENIEYCDAAIAGLNKLSKEIITDKAQITNENTIYLLLTDASKNIYEQWLLINGTPTMIGTTEMKLDNVYTKDEADGRYSLLTNFNDLKDAFDTLKDEIGTETLSTTSQTVKGAINEVADKSAIITLTKAEYDALATKDPETYYITTDDMTMYKGESQVLGGKPLIGKETVLYEGSISAAGTYTLTDDVNNYDFIMISYTALGGENVQTLTMSKIEISKCIDVPHCFMCVYGYAANDSYIVGYFNNDKLILNGCNGLILTSITGYKFGQITVQNTITNPSPGESYSTDEQVIGTWIDGKPLYRKVVNFGTLPNTTTKSVAHGIPIKYPINAYGYIRNPAADASIAIPYNNTIAASSSVSCWVDYKNINITTGIDRTAFTECYVVIEYTKTTDA